MTKPDALALADALDGLCIEPLLDIRSAAELRRLHAENESLKKAQSILQQHHATAWNRGHEMGMMANRKIANEAMKAVAQDAWGNTQLTEALMAAEAEAEALRKDADRYRWLRNEAWGCNNKRGPHLVTFKPGYLPSAFTDLAEEAADAAIDAALAGQGKEAGNGA